MSQPPDRLTRKRPLKNLRRVSLEDLTEAAGLSGFREFLEHPPVSLDPLLAQSAPAVPFPAPAAALPPEDPRQQSQPTGGPSSAPTGGFDSQPIGVVESQPIGDAGSRPTGGSGSSDAERESAFITRPTGGSDSEPVGVLESEPIGVYESRPTGGSGPPQPLRVALTGVPSESTLSP